MREIKFRMWDAAQHKMRFPNGDISPGVFWEKGYLLPIQDYLTLLQFTGLHDKDGKEIYEGDIVRVNNRYRRFPHDDLQDLFIITQIEFSNGSFWFRGGGYTDCNWHHYGAEHLEVIGNIYEHTELLEAK